MGCEFCPRLGGGCVVCGPAVPFGWATLGDVPGLAADGDAFEGAMTEDEVAAAGWFMLDL